MFPMWHNYWDIWDHVDLIGLSLLDAASQFSLETRH